MKQLLPGLRQFGNEPPGGECCAMYLVGEGKKDLAVIDIGRAASYGWFKDELKSEGLTVDSVGAVYITHGHSDHYEGAVPFALESKAPVYMGQAGRAGVGKGDYWLTAGFFYGQHSLPFTDTLPIGNGYVRSHGGVLVRAHETEGHTDHDISYEMILRLGGIIRRVVAVGDIGHGGTHPLIGSNAVSLKRSVKYLRRQNFDDVLIGHGSNALIDAGRYFETLDNDIDEHTGIKYPNAYDEIPPENFDIRNARPATDVGGLIAA